MEVPIWIIIGLVLTTLSVLILTVFVEKVEYSIKILCEQLQEIEKKLQLVKTQIQDKRDYQFALLKYHLIKLGEILDKNSEDVIALSKNQIVDVGQAVAQSILDKHALIHGAENVGKIIEDFDIKKIVYKVCENDKESWDLLKHLNHQASLELAKYNNDFLVPEKDSLQNKIIQKQQLATKSRYFAIFLQIIGAVLLSLKET